MFDRSVQVSRLPKAYRETIFKPLPAHLGEYPGREIIAGVTDERLKRAGATPGQAAAIGRSAALLGMDPSLWALWRAVVMGLDLVVFKADETGEKVAFSEWKAGTTFLLPVPFPWLADYTPGDSDRVLGLRIGGQTFTTAKDRGAAEQLAAFIGRAVQTLSAGYRALDLREKHIGAGKVPYEKLAQSYPAEETIIRFATQDCAAIWWYAGFASGRCGGDRVKNPFGAGRKKIEDTPEVVEVCLEILKNHKLNQAQQLKALEAYWESRGETRHPDTLRKQLRRVERVYLNGEN